jgi:nitrogen-specific signal transduction histidine kinase
VTTRDLGNAVEVQVRDNGVGIAPDIRDKLFQPFFTTKPTGEGTGLGLSISYDIVTQQPMATMNEDAAPANSAHSSSSRNLDFDQLKAQLRQLPIATN